MTNFSERLMQPNFGSVGYESLFRNMSNGFDLQRVEDRLSKSIEVSDNRIIVVDLKMTPADKTGTVSINMTFKLDNYSEFFDISMLIEE